MDYRLPRGYRASEDTLPYIDNPSRLTYQPSVYAFAGHVASRAKLKWIVDIGCGSATKLLPFVNDFSIVGIDASEGVDLARRTIPRAKLIVHDLELGLPRLRRDVVKNSVVICSDVVEHLRHPEVLLRTLADLSGEAPFVLISTPDRDRARGWLDNGPPQNAAHVMEWNGTEFVRFMHDCGFKRIPFYGHTINTDLHRAKSTILTISGTQAGVGPRFPLQKVAAIVHGYNEADILPEVFRHLRQQGVDVHYFDNWSTDGSWETALDFHRSGEVVHLERFPDRPGDQYRWHDQLAKTTEYARTLDANWILHHDADEIRMAPWENVTLREAISWVDSAGYNAIDFTVLDFRFLSATPQPSPPFQESLTQFEFGRRPGHFVQVKGWKNRRKVVLADSGGHDAVFDGRRIYPVKFLLKHYPLRNREQAGRKIHQERLPRYASDRKNYGWHTQYDRFESVEEIAGWKHSELIPWHPVHFASEYLVERLSGIGLED